MKHIYAYLSEAILKFHETAAVTGDEQVRNCASFNGYDDNEKR